jgi:hypothetical protein
MADQVELRERISMAPFSFANDITPTCSNTVARWPGVSILTSYEDVKANAEIIATQTTGDPPGMPPPLFDPLLKTFTDAFAAGPTAALTTLLSASATMTPNKISGCI